MFAIEIVELVATRVLARLPLGYGQEPCEVFGAALAALLNGAINIKPVAIALTATRFEVITATLPYDAASSDAVHTSLNLERTRDNSSAQRHTIDSFRCRSY
jgi:hypothetical protein